MSLLEPHMKIVELCYYLNVVKEEKKNTNIDQSQNVYEKSYCPTNKTSGTSKYQ